MNKAIDWKKLSTVETLPLEEILVRGSEEPITSHATLLKPTTTTQETKVEELLRSSQE